MKSPSIERGQLKSTLPNYAPMASAKYSLRNAKFSRCTGFTLQLQNAIDNSAVTRTELWKKRCVLFRSLQGRCKVYRVEAHFRAKDRCILQAGKVQNLRINSKLHAQMLCNSTCSSAGFGACTVASLLCVVLVGSATGAVQSLPFHDPFDYPDGNLYSVAAGVWDAGGNTGPEIAVAGAAALTSPAGLAPGSGKGVRWAPSGTARRAVVQFTPVTNADNNTVYVSFLLNIQTPPSSGSKLVAYLETSSSSTTSPQLGIFVDSASRIGIGKKTTTPVVLSESLSAGTHLVVVRYTFFVSGNDQVDLWVDPPASTFGANTAPASLGSTSGSSDPNTLSYFHIYTPSGAGPVLYLDEVRISTNWAQVTPAAAPQPPQAPRVPRITRITVEPVGVVLSGTAGPTNAAYYVLTSTNIDLPLEEWTVIGTNRFSLNGEFNWTNTAPEAGPVAFYCLRVSQDTIGLSPPTIIAQPQSRVVLPGQDASFSVVATGTQPLSYQWYFNTNTPVPGGTNSTLLITNVRESDLGWYYVVVGNPAGAVTSAPAQLAFGEPPTDGTYFVSPTGNDANAGTIDAPFYSVQKAVSLAGPGDVIYVRGGTYYYTQMILITNSGTADRPIKLWSYPGERPYLNFTNQPYGPSYRGILITTNGNYWHIKGLEIGYAGDNGMKIEGSHNIIEQCIFHHCGDAGLQIGFGHYDSNPDGQLAAYNLILNCDSYLNFDFDNMGSDADGFACKMHNGRGNVFVGCRAWRNSDDGWDLFETDHAVLITNCWTWHNGDRADFEAIYLARMGKPMSSFQGNGNGFKLGGNGAGGSSLGTHIVMNCVSFDNNSPGRTRHGFDQNSHKDGVVLYNCLAWSNLYNYFFEESVNAGKSMVFKNNVSFAGAVAEFGTGSIEQNNSWNLPVTANAADYVDLSEAAAAAPRNPDGSLPTGFARLVAGSDLIDKGVDVGLPFAGVAPDLGPYEFTP